jgi:hypothetical protein
VGGQGQEGTPRTPTPLEAQMYQGYSVPPQRSPPACHGSRMEADSSTLNTRLRSTAVKWFTSQRQWHKPPLTVIPCLRSKRSRLAVAEPSCCLRSASVRASTAPCITRHNMQQRHRFEAAAPPLSPEMRQAFP